MAPSAEWPTTTFANAQTLLAEAGETATKLGVIRCYLTRHDPGPFVTEDPALELPEPRNGAGRWQGPFRSGHLDAIALPLCRQYAAGGRRLTRLHPGPDRDLAHAGQLTRMLLSARPVYDETERIAARDWPDLVAEITGAPVAIRSYGPAAADKTAADKTAADKITSPAPITRPAALTAPPR